MRNPTSWSFVGVMAVILLVFWGLTPFILIWSLNVLFGLGLMVTPVTWLAALALVVLIGGAPGRRGGSNG